MTGKSPDGEEVTATGRVGLGVTAVSQLELEKTASQLVDANHSGSLDPGDTVAFSFRLTNTGSDTLTKINISDPMLSADALDCPATSLAPSESSTCGPYPYTLKKSDLEEGSLTNEASASASSADGPIPKSVATARVELAGTGSLPLPDETTEPSPSEQPDPGTTPDGSANAGSANGESTAGGSGNDDSAASGANSADADSTSDVSGDSDSAAGDSATGGSANGDATTGESESGGSADGSGELAESGGSSDALLGSYAAGLLLIGSVAALRIGRRRTP